MSDVTRTVTPPAGFALSEAPAHSSAYVIALCAVAALGGYLFGFDSGVINGTVDALANAFGTRAATTGFAVASVLLGCAVGAFLAGTIADIYGRRPTMLRSPLLPPYGSRRAPGGTGTIPRSPGPPAVRSPGR